MPGIGQLDVAAVFVGVVVHARVTKLRTSSASRGGGRDSAVHAAGNDQRHARLVDQQRVGFVDQREMKRADARGRATFRASRSRR